MTVVDERAAPGSTGLRHLHFDLDTRPFLVLFELTRACDLACRHCRAEASRTGEPGELYTAEVQEVLNDLASLGSPRPIVVLTGGDPLSRPDLLAIVRHGAHAGLKMAVSPSATPRVTPQALAALREAGASAVSFSIDGARAETHDDFRGVPGSFGWTVAGCRAALDVGLHVQLNTTVTARTARELPEMLALALELKVSLWSLFFLVSTGRGRELEALRPEETEDVLEFLHEAAAYLPLKTTEAPQYRRIVRRHREDPDWRRDDLGPLYDELHARLPATAPTRVAHGHGHGHGTDARDTGASSARRRPPLVVGDARGVVFVSHCGDVQPSGFLPLVAGNVRTQPLSEIYAQSPLLRELRDPTRLTGRCAVCEWQCDCGGSRAMAYAASGDAFGEDPNCAYQPARPTAAG